MSFSQDSLAIWQKELEYAKNKPHKEYVSDVDFLYLADYTYKGVIKSEAERTEIIDSLFSDHSLGLLRYSPVVVNDTIARDNFNKIRQKENQRFEIAPMRIITEFAKMKGEKNPYIQIKEELKALIKVGFQIVELEWSYKNNKYHTMCIVSDKPGNLIYDSIGHFVTSETREKTLEETISESDL